MAPPVRFIWMATVAVAAVKGSADAAAKAVCYGFEEEWGLCNKDKCTPDCVPRACSWRDWSEWTDMGGCIGLSARERVIKDVNNECGAPCQGNKYETKEHLSDAYKSRCVLRPIDCEWSQWGAWSECNNRMDQRYSQRAFVRHPKDGGKPCVGEVKRTMPCTNMTASSSNGDFDCKFSEWAKWTNCSRHCDGGHKTRTRRVTAETRYGGIGCKGSISQTSPCNEQTCVHTKNCTLTEWSNWTSCASATAHGPFQRYRTRDIKSPATGAGFACEGNVKEASSCDAGAQAEDCVFAQWQKWGKCTATCGGGQEYRNRILEKPAQNGGRCRVTNMQETHGCHTNSCPRTCTYAEWTDWSDCAPKCGAGVQTRDRTVTGYDCKGPIKVVRNCTTECPPTDCKWSDWGGWSTCSLTCGGGTHIRSREVTQTPQNGGKECEPFTTREIGACKNVTCGPDCIDGKWTEWTEWSQCSVTCQSGYQTRTRQVAVSPNHCGQPATGETVEVQKCKAASVCVEETDCKLSEWAGWGTCQRDCFGVQEKTRQITQYAKGFYGKPCENATLKVVQPCNPREGEPTPDKCKVGPKSVDCAMAGWDEWSVCSVKCGPGQKERVRGINTFPAGNGKPCNAALKETDRCEVKECTKPTCIDCQWGAWSEWGACMGKCEGQTYRHRNIAQLANWCGKNCTADRSVETTKCSRNCPSTYFCTWSEWETTSSCDPNACGPRTSRDRRTLKIVDKPSTPAPLSNGTKYQACHGVDDKVKMCPFKSCSPDPVDCEWNDWGNWSEPACSQLCESVRTIKTMNRNNGKACSGALRKTKVCKKECETPIDCVLSDWTSWSTCESDNGQTYRMRDISKMMQFGGKVCTGHLQETRWCTEVKKAVDCQIGDWTEWADCTVTCNGGTHVRKRSIKTQSHHGGTPCNATMEEVAACGKDACPTDNKPVDCKISVWSEWKADTKSAQKQRDRQIETQPLFNGEPCKGTLQELAPIDKVDCVVSEWNDWDTCDRPCENGQQQRKRQVDQHPRFGGKACPYPLSLLEVQGCTGKDKNCDAAANIDAEVHPWTKWSDCTTSCGPGQQTRDRNLKKERGALGRGFTGELKQTRVCPNSPMCGMTDCRWHDWAPWSACSKVCAGGEQSRSRDIAQAPVHRGKACEALPGGEMRPCNEHPCETGKCINGTWNDWSHWGACSSSCLGGVKHRHRTVKQHANYCGRPVEGPDRMYEGCNTEKSCSDTDCKFALWDTWSACTQKCDGITRRERKIKTIGSGLGKFCEGGLTVLNTCNPSANTSGCTVMKKEDCVWSEWTTSACSATCGRGDLYRKRTIKTKAVYGGNPCAGDETDVQPCKDLKPCPKPEPIDCKWGNWSDWSACSKCGGQRKRFRDIQEAPEHGGKKCEDTDTVETQGCLGKEFCAKTYCIWASWADWGACSRKCGTGKRMRRRNLHETADKPKDDPKSARLFNTYQELQEQLKNKSGERWQEMFFAFFCGGLSLVVLGGAFRVCSARLRRPTQVVAPRVVQHSEEQSEFPGSQSNSSGYSRLYEPHAADAAME